MPQNEMQGVHERLASIDTRLSHIEATLDRQDKVIERGRSQFQQLELRDRETGSRIAAALEGMAKEIAELNERIGKQNSRVRKLELWKAEMSARTGLIAAIVSTLITIILTVGGWFTKLRLGG